MWSLGLVLLMLIGNLTNVFTGTASRNAQHTLRHRISKEVEEYARYVTAQIAEFERVKNEGEEKKFELLREQGRKRKREVFTFAESLEEIVKWRMIDPRS